MSKIKTFVVEDEAPARERLLAFVEAHPQLTPVGWSDTGEEAIRQITHLKPDLIFLDVQLPDISGLDVLKLIPDSPAIIFSTAFDRYAVEAFEHNAIDYLLKPYDYERFSRAVEKALQRLLEQGNRPLGEKIETHIPSFQPLQRIPARIGGRIYLLPVAEIVFFSSEDKVVLAHLAEKSFIINYTLDELEKRLDPEQFFRIHRSTIVNLNYVHAIEPYLGGTYIMEVRDKHHSQLTISRNAAKRLRKKLGW